MPYTTCDDVSGIMTSHGPSHLCSQFYIGPQLLQLPLTLQAAPPSTYTQTLLPFRSVCVALCFLKTGATPGSVMFLSLSPAFSRHQYCQPFSVFPFHLFDRTLNAFPLPTVTSLTPECLVWAHSLPGQPITAESHHNRGTEQLVPCVLGQEAERDEQVSLVQVCLFIQPKTPAYRTIPSMFKVGLPTFRCSFTHV